MDSNGSYAVSNVIVRQSPQLGPTGAVTQTTVVSFMVGEHGPFSLTWPGPAPAPSDVVAAITAQVERIRALATGIDQLNRTA